MPVLTIDDHDLFYTRKGGPAAAPALLLIHGAGGSHLGWPPQLRRLPQAAVYTVDLPGHGRSTGPGHETIGGYAAILQKLIATLQLDKVVLAGHSMGGAIAQELALQQPAWLRGLVLMATGACLPVNSRLLAQTTADFQAAVDFVIRYSWSLEAPADLVATGQAQLAQARPEVLHADLLACSCFDRRDDLRRIAVPTLVITGSADHMVPPAAGEHLAATIPGAQLLELEGAGHMLMLERAGAIATAVGDFITRLSGKDTQ